VQALRGGQYYTSRTETDDKSEAIQLAKSKSLSHVEPFLHYRHRAKTCLLHKPPKCQWVMPVSAEKPLKTSCTHTGEEGANANTKIQASTGGWQGS
jgi:hypothetical protein